MKSERQYQRVDLVGKVWVCVFVCVEAATVGTTADYTGVCESRELYYQCFSPAQSFPCRACV